MWPTFIYGFLVLAALLFIPGFLMAKAFLRSYVDSLCFAPSISIACYELISIIYGELGIFTNWISCFVPLTILSALVCFVSYRVHPDGFRYIKHSKQDELINFGIAALYIICGVVFVGLVIVKGFDGADSYGQSYDNYYHLTVPQVYVESGNWSTFHPSLFANTSSGGYYPAEWHMVVALVASVLCAPIAVSVNIVNSFFSSIIFACGMYLFLSRLFLRNRLAVVLGSVATFSFAAFPYMALCSGLMPNFTSVCLVPYPLAAFISSIRVFTRDRKIPKGLIAVFVFSTATVGFCHPSSFFTVLVALVIIGSCFILRSKKGTPWKKILAATIPVACLFLFLLIMFNTSLVKIMATYPTLPADTPQQAVIDVISFSFIQGYAQIVVSIITLIGAISLIVNKQNRWLLIAFIVFSVIFCLTAAINEKSIIRSFLTAYWYSNSWRTSWNVILFAIPLFAAGLSSICRVVSNRSANKRSARNGRNNQNVYVGGVVVLVLMLVPLFPTISLRGFFDIESAFGNVENKISVSYDMKSNEKAYTPKESKFADKVVDLVGEDVVMNIPHDGSFLSFPANGVNTFSRTFAVPGGDARLLSTRLNEYATDDAVREAVERANIQYVLLLDEGKYGDKGDLGFFYNPSLWTGVYSIDEKTEGFDLVLEEGDMRLYKLTL